MIGYREPARVVAGTADPAWRGARTGLDLLLLAYGVNAVVALPLGYLSRAYSPYTVAPAWGGAARLLRAAQIGLSGILGIVTVVGLVLVASAPHPRVRWWGAFAAIAGALYVGATTIGSTFARHMNASFVIFYFVTSAFGLAASVASPFLYEAVSRAAAALPRRAITVVALAAGVVRYAPSIVRIAIPASAYFGVAAVYDVAVLALLFLARGAALRAFGGAR